jgi:hypothetical protein
MDNSPSDVSRLRDAEAQMRRALGRDENSAPVGERPQPTSPPVDQRFQRRKVVRDGLVPVTVVRYSNGLDRDQLEAARAALRSLATAKERAERLLTDAQAKTRLAHERLARDEAIRRAEADRKAIEEVLQTARSELGTAKIARECAERGLWDAQVTIFQPDREVLCATTALRLSGGSPPRG